jgi:hypothetical protein
MLSLISIFLLASLDPIKNFVPLKTYISENAKIHCYVYFINEDIPDFPRVNILEKNKKDFFDYLDTIGIEHTKVGSYYFFNRKNK